MMFVFGGRAARGRAGSMRESKTGQKKGSVLLGKGYNGRAYRKTSAYLCSAILKKIPEHTEERKEKRCSIIKNFFSPNKYSHTSYICNWNLPRQFLPKSVQIVPKLITLFWKKCWNQLHKFGRNVEINDINLEEMWKSMTWFRKKCGNQWHGFGSGEMEWTLWSKDANDAEKGQ